MVKAHVPPFTSVEDAQEQFGEPRIHMHSDDLKRVNVVDAPDYKFNENNLIREFADYIDNTYGGHYGQGGLQSSEVIVDRGHGMGFFLGNVDKYNGRYGKKGTPADHRKDIMKIIHYGFLALYEHDRIHENDTI
mgnify:FL=1|jgi:hypothetical protein